MRSTRRLAVFAVTALALSACATSGLYQAREAESGYAETQLGASHWPNKNAARGRRFHCVSIDRNQSLSSADFSPANGLSLRQLLG